MNFFGEKLVESFEHSYPSHFSFAAQNKYNELVPKNKFCKTINLAHYLTTAESKFKDIQIQKIQQFCRNDHRQNIVEIQLSFV
jgi:hypothetical protein